MKKWSRPEVAEFLGVSERQVGRYSDQEEDPLPYTKEARATWYDPIATKEWVIRKALSSVHIDDDGKAYVYEIEKARLTHHQANITAMEEDIKRAGLIPAEVLEKHLFNIFSSLRAKALSIPTKCAHRVCQLTESNNIQAVESLLKELVDEALTEMSNNNVRRIISGGIGEDSPESAEATTETDSQ